MSRNSKNATNLARARNMAATHKSGGKGPKSTVAIHGKRFTYRSNPEIQKRIAEMLKATTAAAPEKTEAKRILKKSGKAGRTEQVVAA